MIRYLIPGIGALLLFAGILAGLVLRFVPPASPYYWLLPPAAVLLGGWLVFRAWGWKTTVAVFFCSAAAALLIRERVWPRLAPAGETARSERPSGEAGRFAPGSAMQETVLRVPETLRTGPFEAPRPLQIPAGFRINVFASGLNGPRFMAVGPGGLLYVSLPAEGKILLLPDGDRDGTADRQQVFAAGLDRPHGLAFVPEGLVVAETGRLVLLQDRDGDLRAESRKILSEDIPSGGGHWTRSVVVGADRFLYVSVGSDCNACRETDRRRGAILRFPPTGGEGTVYASGLRNSVGLAVHPVTGDLWASDNGRDFLGDDLPPDEINRIVEGGDYGWPFCFGDRAPDPDLGSAGRCAGTLPASAEIPAHSAPLGIAFGFDLQFPPPFRNALYVAYHGSWNRTSPTGYKVVAIPFEDGRPSGPPRDIVTGWLVGRTAWGRPVQPLVGADGALYISDDRAGAIYRLAAPVP